VQQTKPDGLTPSQTVGPYFAYGLTSNGKYDWNDAFSNNLVTPDTSGERIRIEGQVFDGDGAVVPDCMLEIWQADAQGRFSDPQDKRALPNSTFKGFGRIGTDAKGGYAFDTIKPGQVADPDGQPQAPHIVLAVFARGMLLHNYSRIYFDGEAANASDPVLALVPADRLGAHARVGLGLDELVGGLEAGLLRLCHPGLSLGAGQELRGGLGWAAHAVFQGLVHDIGGHLAAFGGGLKACLVLAPPGAGAPGFVGCLVGALVAAFESVLEFGRLLRSGLVSECRVHGGVLSGGTPHSGQCRFELPWVFSCLSRYRSPCQVRVSFQSIPAALMTAMSRAPPRPVVG